MLHCASVQWMCKCTAFPLLINLARQAPTPTGLHLADGGASMEPWVVGIDLGATKVALGLIDPENRIVARRRFAMAETLTAAAVVDRIAGAVEELASALPAEARIAGVALCSPGPLDHHTGIILDPPNVPSLHHVPLARLLEVRLKLPVCLEHDAKASALGEYHFGAGQGAHSMVYIVVGTGVGAAIIVDGQLFRGSTTRRVKSGTSRSIRRASAARAARSAVWRPFLPAQGWRERIAGRCSRARPRLRTPPARRT